MCIQQSSLDRQSRVVQQICGRLYEICCDIGNSSSDEDVPSSTNGQRNGVHDLIQVVTALGHAFTKLVDIRLSREIKVRIMIIFYL